MVASVRAKNRNLGLCFCKRTTLNVSLDRTWFKSLPWAFCEKSFFKTCRTVFAIICAVQGKLASTLALVLPFYIMLTLKFTVHPDWMILKRSLRHSLPVTRPSMCTISSTKKKRFDATSVPWCRITSFGHQSLRPVCSWHKWTVI